MSQTLKDTHEEIFLTDYIFTLDFRVTEEEKTLTTRKYRGKSLCSGTIMYDSLVVPERKLWT